MTIKEVTIGNTICLRGTFTTFDGQLPTNEPTDIVLRLYDQNEKQYGEDIEIKEVNKVSKGVYDYYYLVPDDRAKLGKEGIMSFKFSAILDDMEISDGGKFKRVFLKNH